MMLRRLLLPALLLLSMSACAQPAAPAAAPKPAARQFAPPTNLVPRPGTDYEVLQAPQPTWGSARGKIEVAEVFSYKCSHCKDFQPLVNAWKKRMPADVRWEYVPGAFGKIWDTFARAFFAAQIMGIQPQTHDKVFYAVFTEQAAGNGSLEDIANMYAKWGVDKAKFLETMSSYGVDSKLKRAKLYAQRTGIEATPTLVVNGKYRVNVNERGFEGMLATADYLIAQERAAMKKPAAKPTGAK